MKEVFRFCDANDKSTMQTHAGKNGVHNPSHLWWITSPKKKEILKRAMEHMDGKTDNSPFASVATDVLALVKYGESGGLRDIIYGVNNPDWNAPHIVRFMVPEKSLISPDDVVAGIPEAKGITAVARARLETELLYFGNDLFVYKAEHKVNPYDKLAYAQMIQAEREKMEAQEKELDRVAAAKAATPALPTISFDRLREQNSAFAEAMARFVTSNSNTLQEIPAAAKNLTRMQAIVKKNPSKIGTLDALKVKSFDAAIRGCNNAELRAAWTALVKNIVE